MSSPETLDINRGPVVVAILWTETAVADIIVFMGFYTGTIIKGISWDDWLMLVTLGLPIIRAAPSTAQSNVGGYLHVQFLSKDEIIDALEVNFFLRAANILPFATGKAAVGSLILRLMGRFNQWQRWVVWVVIVLTAIVNILNCIFNFVQCRPIIGENIMADVILAILPATIYLLESQRQHQKKNLFVRCAKPRLDGGYRETVIAVIW